MEEFVEVIGVEHLKTVLSGLTPEEIVKPAYDNWMGGVKTGHTVLNLETGNVYGLGIDFNQLPLADEIYIELFTIESHETPVSEEDFFSKHEYEEFLEFSSVDPCEYIPDIITDFCEMKGIDEYERTIGILAYNFEKKEQSNYNMWESRILNKYYDAIYENHNPFEFSQSSL
ncbi:MAG: hypothetical protein IKF13_04850, partial [Methanobrevibacter sp.]|uniref:hypothetical protein n=1 Tax=Methanobrevibacter sp. UBA212 TaxID=1915476 RepID=UPI0025F6EA1D|nr:hypothetical protein [Methanobrevibacter sp. UBA212]MBR3156127.1 hypothetical protein [Methanobrevibacter sp.]